MGIFASVRERVPLIKCFVNFQKTGWYPAFLAVLCFLSGISGYTIYVPMLWFLLCLHLFSVLFADDRKVFLTSLLMMYFALGRDTVADSFYAQNGKLLSFMDGRALPHIVAICSIGVTALLLRLIFDGSLWAALKKRKLFIWGILAMDAAFLLNGLFGADSRLENLGYGALIAMGFTVIYLLVLSLLEGSEDPITYACQVTLSVAYAAAAQIATVILQIYADGKFIGRPGGEAAVNKALLTLGWGVSSVISAIFVLGIPAAMYLAKNRKLSWFTFFSCPIFIIVSTVMNTRSSLVVSALIFLICTVACCISGKNKKYIRIYTAVAACLAVIAFIYITERIIPLEELLRLLRLTATNESNRTTLWDNGIEDFLSSPIFGIGFANGCQPTGAEFDNFYSNMYHCIVIEVLGATGIFGCIAFVFHIVQIAVVFFKRFSVDKLLLLAVPVMIIGMSLFDNFFFYLQFHLFYGAFLALADYMYQNRNNSNNKDGEI